MGENTIEEKCLDVVDNLAEDVLKSDEFSEITLSTVERILNRDTLNAGEVDVYKACIRWAEAECNRQLIEVNHKLRKA